MAGVGRPKGWRQELPTGTLTIRIIRYFDEHPYVSLSSIAEAVGTSRQMVQQALLRWRNREYQEELEGIEAERIAALEEIKDGQ